MPHAARLLALLALLPFALPAEAAPPATPIQLTTSHSLGPDGEQLAFAWRGDIWVAGIDGSGLRRMTRHPAKENYPALSPDGKLLAFTSNRTGSDQVYVMPLAGGEPRRITSNTEGFVLYGWYADSKAVLVRTNTDREWRHSVRFYRRSLEETEAPELVFDASGGSAHLQPGEQRLAFVREGVSWWRKHYRGPAAGQIWTVEPSTKTYTKLTQGEHGERWPQWSADGTRIYFASQQDGTWNLWSMDAKGGDRRQLTTFEGDGVLFPRISADGRRIVFRHLFELWTLETKPGAKPTRVPLLFQGDATVDTTVRSVLNRASEAAWTSDGREVAFISGGDLYVMDTTLREPKRVTRTPAEERDPVFSSDFRSLYFVSDAAGDPDVFVAKRSNEDVWWWENDEFDIERLTRDAAPEQNLTLVPETKDLAFIHGGGTIVRLDPTSGERTILREGWSEPSFDFSPDGKWMVWAAENNDFNTDVWIEPVDQSREPFNLSRHPDHDWSPRWSPDGKRIAFLGRRSDDEIDVYYVNLLRADDQEGSRERKLEEARKKMKGRKAKPAPEPEPTPDEPAAPKTSEGEEARNPEGTWTGALQGEPPIPPAGLACTVIVTKGDEGYTADVEIPGQFEAKGVTFTFEASTGSFSLETSTPMGPIQIEGKVLGSSMEGTWILGAMKGTFALERQDTDEDDGSEAKPATKKPESKKPASKTKKVEPVRIDWEGLEDRVRRITIADSSESNPFWSYDGKKLAFTATVGGARGTYTVTFPDSLKPKKLSSTTASDATWIAEGKQILWVAGGTLQSVSSSGKATAQSFTTRTTHDARDRRFAAFRMAWRLMRDNFYDPAHGGNDWDAILKKYTPFAEDCVSGEEIEQVIDTMLGELGGSHLGFRSSERGWSAPGWRETTGHLGLRFDMDDEGEGLLVREVIETGPADRTRSRVEVGERILAIDGRPVTRATHLARLLTGIPGRFVEVEVRGTDGKERVVQMRPTSYGAMRTRLYEAWIETNQARVAQASNGTMGYLHIRSMNWPSFQRFERDLYKAAHGKEGLIIDVRENGGGFTADHLLTCLTQPRHALTRPRGGGIGYPQGRMVYARWDKPVVVLCNQNSFSNAEIFSHAIKTLERGKVVGVTTAGGVISTGSANVMGLGSLRMPFRGWYLVDSGEDMEMHGCVPHVTVWPEPEDMIQGIDRQLDKGIEVLGEEVAAWKARPVPPLKRESERR